MTKVLRYTAIAALAAVALAAAGCGGGDEEGTGDTGATDAGTVEAGATLTASVGPGFEISLTTEDGQAVTTVSAGEYTIEVDDQSDIHNFHLTGSGVDEDSGVSETGQSTWTVTFEEGTYSFVCDPHQSSMNGDFEVTG
jgi:plastocyanin